MIRCSAVELLSNSDCGQHRVHCIGKCLYRNDAGGDCEKFDVAPPTALEGSMRLPTTRYTPTVTAEDLNVCL